MASPSKQTEDPLASTKDQENKINTTQEGHNSEDYVQVRSGQKRKASGDRATDRKRQRDSDRSSKTPNIWEPVSMPHVLPGRSKRKASPGTERPQKRHRGSCSTSDTSKLSNPLGRKVKSATTNTNQQKVLVDEVKAGKRKASTGAETPSPCCSSLQEQENDNTLPKVNTSRADFEAKYKQLKKIGQGGFGSVYAGIRIMDFLPVAIKHIGVPSKANEPNKIPREVVLMQKVAGGPESIGKCAAVSLLDWYHLGKEIILVMERPVQSMDLLKYLQTKGGSLEEQDAKILMAQLLDAAIEMHDKGVFHRDIKCANILLDVSPRVPRLRIIDFGCGSAVRKRLYQRFAGTIAFAPPEWHIHNKYKADPTTVWQLGAVLHCMLHGSRFSTVSFVSGLFPFSSKLSQDCRDFLQQCLAIKPKNRGTLQQLKLHPWLK